MKTIIKAVCKAWAKRRLRAISYTPGTRVRVIIWGLEHLCSVLREQLEDGEWTPEERAAFVEKGVDAISTVVREVQDA